MRLTVLVDNNTLIDRYYYGEPGVCYYIQEGGRKLLFDTGYSDIFMTNARKMNISMNDVDYVVISHGHLDHTWGLFYLTKFFSEAFMEKQKYMTPSLIAHPDAFKRKQINDKEEIGSIMTEEKLNGYFDMKLTKEPLWITSKLVFLGEIKRTNDFENKTPVGQINDSGYLKDDYLLDDSALVYKSKKGLVIITGCSHSGICNIVEYAKKICGDSRVLDIVGGFHLQNPKEEVLTGTKEYIGQNSIGILHTGHCTDLKSKIELAKVADVREIGVGLVLEY